MAADLERLEQSLLATLTNLEAASRIAKPLHQGQFYDAVVRLIREPGGVRVLARHAERYGRAGAFVGTDWDHPAMLQPRLVRRSLYGDIKTIAIEIISELRFIAIAQGHETSQTLLAEDARSFLSEVLALNIDLTMESTGEAERAQDVAFHVGVSELFTVISEVLAPGDIVGALVGEIEGVLYQRPVLVHHVRGYITDLRDKAASGASLPEVLETRVRRYTDALFAPGPLSADDPGIEAYRRALNKADVDALRAEARACAASLHDSLIASRYHAVLLHHVNTAAPDLVSEVLGLTALGEQSLMCYRSLISALIEHSVSEHTAQSVFGLWAMLERGVMFTPPVAPALWRQISMQPNRAAAAQIANVYGSERDAAHFLLAGTIMILGHPLGVGQGNNPTCQAARAISLFAQLKPDYLLQLICWAARDGEIVMAFEGAAISSRGLEEGLAPSLAGTLDPVSLVLVPMLDRIYAEMGRRTLGRGEDGHKWINPAFHGWWVPLGCRTVVDIATGNIRDFAGFQRNFFASYHPFYNGNQPVIHPQPAGIASTNPRGRFIGWHAISIQRVALDPSGVMRVYFHNPNNEGRQQWGRHMHTSTRDNGELPGESSLRFEEFASRLYLFHFDPLDEGDPDAVTAAEIDEVAAMARESWAADRMWT